LSLVEAEARCVRPDHSKKNINSGEESARTGYYIWSCSYCTEYYGTKKKARMDPTIVPKSVQLVE